MSNNAVKDAEGVFSSTEKVLNNFSDKVKARPTVQVGIERTKEGIDVPYCINDRNTWASISNKVKSGEPPK